MEEQFKIPTGDGLNIYGVKNHCDRYQNSAIIIVHGMAGHIYEHMHKFVADEFENRYDVYRFNFYSANRDARKLIDCDLSTHVKDFETVLKFVSEGYKRVYLIGHSYGGPVIMNSKLNDKVKAASLIDPSFALDSFGDWESVQAMGGRKFYIMPTATHMLVNESMYKDIKKITRDYCIDIGSKFTKPLQIIHGTKDMFGHYDASYNLKCPMANVREYIEDAKHNFSNEDFCTELVERLGSWINHWKTWNSAHEEN